MIKIAYRIMTNKRIAKAICKCFDGVNWDRQTFSVNGQHLKDSNGNTVFYAAEDIDKAIRKMNRVLKLIS